MISGFFFEFGEARGQAIGEAVGEVKKARSAAKVLLDQGVPVSIIMAACPRSPQTLTKNPEWTPDFP
jgi:hypothetical protein